jgi:hypothetical protein
MKMNLIKHENVKKISIDRILEFIDRFKSIYKRVQKVNSYGSVGITVHRIRDSLGFKPAVKRVDLQLCLSLSLSPLIHMLTKFSFVILICMSRSC